MFKPLALFIGLRYTRTKRRDQFISFISLASMLGIALGVAVLITVLSVINGFDYEIRHRLFNLAPQVTISGAENIPDWRMVAKKIIHQPDVVAVAPLVNAQGMLTYMGNSTPVSVHGIIPDAEKKVSQLASYLQIGSFESLTPDAFNMVVGEGLATSLGLVMGDKVILLTPQKTTTTPASNLPNVQFKPFTISGIFHVEGNMEADIDRAQVFINMQDAQSLYQLDDAVSSLQLKVSDLYVAPYVSNVLKKILPSDYSVSNWTQAYGPSFENINTTKTMLFFIMVMIIAVATFNLVSTLVMVVNSKQAEIAILRTLGSTPIDILTTFIVQGFIIGVIGTILGVLGGVLLASYVTELVNFIQTIFHVQFISSSVYYGIDYLPSRLEWSDVWQISLLALGLSLLATIYPAWHASCTHPAEALRYE